MRHQSHRAFLPNAPVRFSGPWSPTSVASPWTAGRQRVAAMSLPAEGLPLVLTSFLLSRLIFRTIRAVRGQRRVMPQTLAIQWHDRRTFYELAAMG